MIYKVSDPPSEFIGSVRNMAFCKIGHVRPHKINGYYYIYQTLPALGDHEEQLVWMRFDLMYRDPNFIRLGVKMDDPTFTVDTTDLLGPPLSQDELDLLVSNLAKGKDLDKPSDLKNMTL